MSGGPGPDNNIPAAGAPPAAPAAAPAADAAPPAPAASAPAPDAAPPAVAPAPAAPVAPPAPPAQAPAPVADAKPADAAPPAADAKPDAKPGDAPKPGEPTSLLSAPPAAEAKPGEQPPADGQPPVPVVEQALPSYEFKAPEGFTVAPDKMGEFGKLLGEFERATGGDHVKFGEHGQKLVDFHLGELQRMHEGAEKASREAWDTMRGEWRTSFRNDPDLGGNRETATLQACAGVIDQFGGNATQRAELRQWLAITGLGDHPGMIRLLSNVQKVFGEGTPRPAPTVPQKIGRAARRYANTNGAA